MGVDPCAHEWQAVNISYNKNVDIKLLLVRTKRSWNNLHQVLIKISQNIGKPNN
jgi:hypothetical protein